MPAPSQKPENTSEKTPPQPPETHHEKHTMKRSEKPAGSLINVYQDKKMGIPLEKNMKLPKSVIDLKPQIRIFKNSESQMSSSGSELDDETASQRVEHRDRTKVRMGTSRAMSPVISTSDTYTSISLASLSSSITRFRFDFEDLKCKMQIFGESLNLCRCIASDFGGKLTTMERRLDNLERRQKLSRSESNYSAIIQKNKKLSSKTAKDAKKLQMCGTEEEMREVAGRICRNYLHGAWKTVEPKELDFKRISGGLSNFLYYVALPEDSRRLSGGYTYREGSSPLDDGKIDGSSSFSIDEPKKVLLRIYGQVHGERAMDAIVTESVIFTLLSERRLGPKLYGVFSGGRIEEYIPARPLLTKELGEPALSMKIAEKMAAIHSMDIPLSKEPNWLWKTMGKWLKTVRDERLTKTCKGKNEEEQNIIKRLKTIEFEKEIEWLKKFIATVDSPVVFCHNDMQEGNILIFEDEMQTANDEYATSYTQTFGSESTNENKTIDLPEDKPKLSMDQSKLKMSFVDSQSRARMSFVDTRTSKNSLIEPLAQYDDANTSDSLTSHISDTGEPKLVLIDFEYCAYNYRGFDIANHFQEWGYDYTNPNHPFYYENTENCPTLEQKEIFIKEYLKHYHANLSEEKEQAPSIDAVNRLLTEVEAFALASHLFWSLWSIVNASKSQIPFGYWEYGQSRIETYLRLKQEVIKKEKFGFPQKRKICEVDI